jgi:hypothetical protein
MTNDPLEVFRSRFTWARGYRGPYHVGSNASARVTSVRRGERFEVTDAEAGGQVYQDGRYYVLSGCSPLHLISGVDHLLVSADLRDVLQRHCGESVSFEPARVRDGATGRDVTGYFELRLPFEVSPESLFRVESEGENAWHFMGRHLFVSERAAAEIDRSGILGLVFAPGFSNFVGRTATASRYPAPTPARDRIPWAC